MRTAEEHDDAEREPEIRRRFPIKISIKGEFTISAFILRDI